MVGGLAQLAQVQAVPHEYPPLRLPTFPSIERTSVLKFVANAQTSVESREKVFILRRDPVVPVWHSAPFTTALTQVYTFDPSTSGLYQKPNFPNLQGGNYDVSILTDTKPFATLLFPATPVQTIPWILGKSSKENWYYIPCGMVGIVSVLVDASPAGGAWELTFESTLDFSTNDASAAATVASTLSGNYINFVVPAEGFFRPLTINVQTAVGNALQISSVYVGFTSNGTVPFTTPSAPASTIYPFIPLLSQPIEPGVPQIYEGARANAVAMLISNSTAVLNKEGTVEAYRVQDSGSMVLNYTTAIGNLTRFSEHAAPPDRYLGLMEKGIYAFTIPDQGSANFRDWTMQLWGGQTVSLVQLDNAAYDFVIGCTDLTAGATNLSITIDIHLEFRNATMLWPIGVSMVPLEEWHKAQLALHKIPCFHENPLHLAAIAGVARAAAMRLAPYAIPLLRSAGQYVLDKTISSISSRIPNMDQRTQVQISRPPIRKVSAKPKPKAKGRK
jgi:hypothetical protein